MVVKIYTVKLFFTHCPKKRDNYIYLHMSKQQPNKKEELRARKIPGKLLNEIHNIARNHNMTTSQFLKPKVIEIIDKYPAEMKKVIVDKKCDLRIRDVPDDLPIAVKNISDHLDIEPDHLVTKILREISSAYPERMKKDLSKK